MAPRSKKDMSKGIAAALSGALLWGFSGACAQIVLSDHGLSPLFITVDIPSLDLSGILVLVVGIGILGTACAFGLYLYGVAIVGSVRGSLLGTAEPASAMVLTALWLGISVTATDWIGLILMVAMVFLVSLPAASTTRA